MKITSSIVVPDASGISQRNKGPRRREPRRPDPESAEAQ
jgi:hypothetical protein